MSVSSPHELMAAIQRDAASLDSGGRKLAQCIQRLGELERDYERELQSALISLYDAAKESGERLPAEDVRRAIAHRKVPSEVYGAFLGKRAEIDALKAWLRTVETSVNARQSLLRALRDELKAS